MPSQLCAADSGAATDLPGVVSTSPASRPASRPDSHPARGGIKAVLFDLDDTLWPTAEVIAHAEQRLQGWLHANAPGVAGIGIDTLRDMRRKLIDTNPEYKINLWTLRQQLIINAFALAGEHDPADLRARAAMQVFAQARNEVQMYADVQPAMAALHTRWMLGSVSNGFADLQQIGLAQYFRVSLAAHAFGRAKPDPAIFHAACAQLGVMPAETVYVGDDLLLDVQGAQQAGLQGVWLQRDLPHVRAQALAAERMHVRPQAICTDLHQLQQWLLEQA